MITVLFKDGSDYGEASGRLWQWDYGQTLRIQGLDLPTAAEIHFSLQQSGGEAVTRIGTTRDGVTEVVIPDSLLEGDQVQPYYIHVWVYLADETSGQTAKTAQIWINTRSKPEAFDKPEEVELFRDAIAAVNKAVEKAEAVGTVTPEQISVAVESYFESNPGTDINALEEATGLDYGIVISEDIQKKISMDHMVECIINRAIELGLINPVISGLSTYSVVNWSDNWSFTKDNSTYTIVNLPHTCNQSDGASQSMYRGKTWYSKDLVVSNDDGTKVFYIIFEAAGQKSTVYVDNVEIISYEGGYTPFIVKLANLTSGAHKIKIMCDNTADTNLIPVSADFNFNNGLHRDVYLFTQSLVGFDAVEFGDSRMHIIPSVVTIGSTSNASAKLSIKAKINNTGVKNINAVIRMTLYERSTGNTILSDSENVMLPSSGSYNYDATFDVTSVHLWNGIKDPFLYIVKLDLLVYGDILVDTLSDRIGFRKISLDEANGFLLNDKSYPLRGVAMHQDYPGVMSAMTKDCFDADYSTVIDIGCNVVRLAHYPHDKYAFQKCDELGLIVQTEIPWVNHCGVNATQEYYDCIKTNLASMIRNHYNHPSIVFWGLSNELNGSHWKGGGDPQGGYSYSKALEWNNLLCTYAKTLDSTRFIGFVAHPNTFNNTPANSADWSADWIGLNLYYGWYYGNFNGLTTALDHYHNHRPFLALTEYGAGGNPATHSETPLTTTTTGTGGAVHDEEYQNLFHESHLEQIQAKPWLVFTSLWVLFDFAVSGRNEGRMPYTNNKGLITRDRQVKKDSFFLYKAAWNPEPMIYITSRRFTAVRPDTISIKVYANTDSVSLYRADGTTLIATLTTATKCGVVWEFNNVSFSSSTSDEVFVVKGTKNGIEVRDEVTFYHEVQEAPGPEYDYHVDIDFTGSNDNLVANDKMGHATVSLSGFTGIATSGFNSAGYLNNTDGTGLVTISNLGLDQLSGPVEIGMEFADFSFTTINHRGRFIMMNDDIYDCYVICDDDSRKYIAIEYTNDDNTTVVGRTPQLSTQHSYSNLKLTMRFDDISQPCSSFRYTRTPSGGTEEEIVVSEMNDYNTPGTTQPLSHFTRAAITGNSIYLLNRSAKDRPLKATLKRFFIRTEKTGRYISATYSNKTPAVGDTVDQSLINVTLTEADGTKQTISDFTITEADLILKAGINTFTINHDGLTCILSILVGTSLVITRQPENVTANACEYASFDIEATGTDMSYQWKYYTNNKWMDASTGASLTVEALGVRNGRQYKCVVSDIFGNSVESNVATLTVNTPTAEQYYDFGRKIAYVPLSGLNENSTVLATIEGYSYPSKDNIGGTHMITSKAPSNNTGTCGVTIQFNADTYESFYLCMNHTPSSQSANVERYSRVFKTDPSILKSYPLTVLLTQDTFKTNYDEVSEYNAIPSPGTLQKYSGYLYINTGDRKTSVTKNPEYYTTSQSLTEAIASGEQYYNFDTLKISRLKVWKDRKYISISEALESAVTPDIDIQIGDDGLPYNAGTSGELVCSL